MILVIISVIPVVGGTSMYISSRLKNDSIRLNSSKSVSWLAPVSFAAYKPWVSCYRHRNQPENTNQEQNTDTGKYDPCR